MVFAISAAVLALRIYLLGYEPANIAILALAVSILFYIVLGTIAGLYTKTVMEALVAVLPSAQLIVLAEGGAAVPMSEILLAFRVMIGWTFLAIAAAMLYKKRMTDD